MPRQPAPESPNPNVTDARFEPIVSDLPAKPPRHEARNVASPTLASTPQQITSIAMISDDYVQPQSAPCQSQEGFVSREAPGTNSDRALPRQGASYSLGTSVRDDAPPQE